MVASNSSAAARSKINSRPRIPLAQRRKARRLVLQALYQWLMSGSDPLVISKQYREETQGKVDWNYFEEVFSEIPGATQKLNESL